MHWRVLYLHRHEGGCVRAHRPAPGRPALAAAECTPQPCGKEAQRRPHGDDAADADCGVHDVDKVVGQEPPAHRQGEAELQLSSALR